MRMYNDMPMMGVPSGAYTQPVQAPRSHGGAFGLGAAPSPMSPYAPPHIAAPAPAAMMAPSAPPAMAPSTPPIPGQQPTPMAPNASSMGQPPIQQQPRPSGADPYTGRYGAIANALLA